jgi:TatD DNase family protein
MSPKPALIDSHCHLDFPDFQDDLQGVVERAREAGLIRMITICTHIRKFDQVLAVAERYEDVYCSVGTHPHNADQELDIAVEDIVRLADHRKVVAIGEAGLDYFYQKSSREGQAQGLCNHIEAARQTGLPLIIHARDADDDMAALLEEEMQKGAFKAVLHCFSSGRDLAMKGLELGLYVSFSGIVTFKKSDELRAIAKDVPLERLLVETDAPFLAPQPVRGKRNEPAFTVETARVIADIHGLSYDELAEKTVANTLRLFDKMPG